MSGENDSTQVVSDFVENRFQDFMRLAKLSVKSLTDTALLYLNATYKAYLTGMYERHSHAKAFLIRDEPTYLYKFYIPLGVKKGKRLIQTPGIAELMSGSQYLIISAPAGSGKSIFMKHLLLNSLLTKWKVPIFFELRHLNNSDEELEHHIFETLRQGKLDIETELMERALKAGQFVLLLDGYDEVDLDRRPALLKSLLALQAKYTSLNIVVSSRPDTSMEGWPRFSMCTLQPLTVTQAIALIDKLPVEECTKMAFVEDLEKNLFHRHHSFASNPLLLSIMFLTYGQSLGIPQKLNVFYHQAYEALFDRHDARKGGFKRQRRTSLDVQDFGKVFSGFCVQTYDARAFEFTKTDAVDYVKTACRLVQVRCEASDYLLDLRESVALLVDDGLVLTFPHRSFQEYFAAKFVADSSNEVQKGLIQKYSTLLRSDNLMKLLYEMRPYLVERHYLAPALTHLFNLLKVKRAVGVTHYVRYIKHFVSSFNVSPNGISAAIKSMEGFNTLDVLRFCKNHAEQLLGQPVRSKESPDEWFFHKYHDASSADEETIVYSSSLTSRSEFTKDMAKYGGAFSMEWLQVGFAALAAIKAKDHEVAMTLGEILDL
jgi:hypothetical protein